MARAAPRARSADASLYPRQAGVADLPTWAEAGKAEYFTDPVTLVLIQGILFNWVEVLRWKDMRNPGSVHEVRRCAARGPRLAPPLRSAIARCSSRR